MRGLAYGALPSATSLAFSAANSSIGKYTSPRTSITSGTSSPVSRSGITEMVRTFGVTSSPVRPSPRVAPRTSRPFSYTRLMASPSTLSSQRNAGCSISLATRSAQAFSSSGEKALSSDSIRSRWSTAANCEEMVPATFWVGESGVRSSVNSVLDRLAARASSGRTRHRTWSARWRCSSGRPPRSAARPARHAAAARQPRPRSPARVGRRQRIGVGRIDCGLVDFGAAHAGKLPRRSDRTAAGSAPRPPPQTDSSATAAAVSRRIDIARAQIGLTCPGQPAGRGHHHPLGEQPRAETELAPQRAHAGPGLGRRDRRVGARQHPQPERAAVVDELAERVELAVRNQRGVHARPRPRRPPAAAGTAPPARSSAPPGSRPAPTASTVASADFGTRAVQRPYRAVAGRGRHPAGEHRRQRRLVQLQDQPGAGQPGLQLSPAASEHPRRATR